MGESSGVGLEDTEVTSSDALTVGSTWKGLSPFYLFLMSKLP